MNETNVSHPLVYSQRDKRSCEEDHGSQPADGLSPENRRGLSPRIKYDSIRGRKGGSGYSDALISLGHRVMFVQTLVSSTLPPKS